MGFPVVAAVLYLAPLLLDAPLTDPDEGLHAVISQEMVERGDSHRAAIPRPRIPRQADPVFLGAGRVDHTFGMNTAAARLPGMLFALLGIATTGWLARVLFSGRA